jgi:transaldolase
MGASFRTKEQVMALCGSDLLTISPDLLSQLAASDVAVPLGLDSTAAQKMSIDRVAMDESTFRWMLNEDAMATEKLAEGIRGFSADLDKLKSYLRDRMN